MARKMKKRNRHRARRVAKKQGNDNKRFFKLKLVSRVSSDAGGIISAGVTDMPSSAQDWASIVGLFDMYRVNAVKLKFIPDSNTAFTDAAQSVWRPLYIVHDMDEYVSPLTSVNVAIQYENCKYKNMLRPWTYYKKMARTISAAGSQTHDLKGYGDCDNPQPNQGIFWYGTGFTASVDYGTLLVTYYLTAKGRK